MALRPGRRGYVLYEEEALHHERLLLAHSFGSNWAVVTPDGDIYVENLRTLEFQLAPEDNSIPLPLNGAELYRFPHLDEMGDSPGFASVVDLNREPGTIDVTTVRDQALPICIRSVCL